MGLQHVPETISHIISVIRSDGKQASLRRRVIPLQARALTVYGRRRNVQGYILASFAKLASQTSGSSLCRHSGQHYGPIDASTHGRASAT
eukprot:6459739-Amphidinium_carterae.1